MARNQKDFTYDNAMLLKDAGAVTADGAAQVSSAARILDLGAARLDGRVIVDVSAIDVSSGDERYDVNIQFSSSATFASDVVPGAGISLGDSSTIPGQSADSVIGRYEFPFSNEINGTTYRYARVYTNVSGTTPSINYTAYIVQAF
jgi:hypothetical protein